ncbi:MAG: outer membrane beta-barrel protein [Bacteroidota bacterium]
MTVGQRIFPSLKQSGTIFFLLFLFLPGLIAQFPPIDIELQGGMLVGTPYGQLPSTVTASSGKPGVNPHIRAIASVQLMPHLSVNTGIGYARKSSSFAVTIEDQLDVGQELFGLNLPIPLNVDYTAKSQGTFDNHYLDVPLYTEIRFKQAIWYLQFGYQYSHLLKGSLQGEAEVNAGFLDLGTTEFDESSSLNPRDHALLFGAGRNLNTWGKIGLGFSYGVGKLFTEVPDGMSQMRNLYGQLLFALRIPAIQGSP